MKPPIENALKHLENANISGYFEEMDKVEMPASLKTICNTHKAEFVAGKASYDFHERLAVFARAVNRRLEDENQTANLESTTMPVKNYNIPNIFKLMNACYNDESLQVFCMLYFEQVFNNFGTGMSKASKLTALIGEAKRRLALDKLLDLVQEEYPQQYERFKPYF
ncbi:MAG: hypothetical protein NW226_00525 [Microscillaceae bacterium]|nr:hypothetical protein [Microscillaceae bacterium]